MPPVAAQRSVLAAAAAALAMLAAPAVATAAPGSIAGTVTASGGAPLADIQVDALDGDGRAVASALTGADGRYRIAGLAAGGYRVRFSPGGEAAGTPPADDFPSVPAPGAAPVGPRTEAALAHDSRDVRIVVQTDSAGAENPARVPPDAHEWVYKLAERLAARFPAYTVRFVPWNHLQDRYRDPLDVQTGTGPHVLTVFGAGQPGRYTADAEAHLRDLVAAPLLADGVSRAPAPDLVIVGQGHNFSQGTVDAKRATMLAFAQVLRRALPDAELAFVAQNPEWGDTPRVLLDATGGTWTAAVGGQSTAPLPWDASPAALQAALEALPAVGAGHVGVFAGATARQYVLVLGGPAAGAAVGVDGSGLTGGAATATAVQHTNGMQDWPAVLQEVAGLTGAGFVDVYAAFRAVEQFPGQMTQVPGGSGMDGTHPTAAGYELWADTVSAQLTAGDPQPLRPSSLGPPLAWNHLRSGDFPVWSAPGRPDDWNAVNATVVRDRAGADRAAGSAAHVAPDAAGAPGYLEQTLTGSALAALRGRWVTVAARMRNDGTDPQAGVVELVDGGPSGTTDASSGEWDEGLGVYRWVTLVKRISAGATSLQVRLYGDAGTDAGGGAPDPPGATFDRVVLVPGVLPRDMVASTNAFLRAQYHPGVATAAAASVVTVGEGATVDGVDARMRTDGPLPPVAPPPAGTRVLSVSRTGDGTGRVASAPAGLDCGPVCSHVFAIGAAVELLARPSGGSRFTGWRGGGCTGTGGCRVTLDAATVVQATFTRIPPPRAAIRAVRVRGRTVTVRFATRGETGGVRCGLARVGLPPRLRPCTSPARLRARAPGRWAVTVQARGPGGTDPVPAVRQVRVR